MIEIKFYGSAEEVRAEMATLLGGPLMAVPMAPTPADDNNGPVGYDPAECLGPATGEVGGISREPQENWTNAAAPAPTRKRGEPSPGRKRRTKEEIAEDEAAEKYEALNAGKLEGAQISTGEARVGPEDDAETAALDAADEAAEVEASRDPQAPLTLDDLRQVVGELNRKMGFAAAVKAVPQILGCAMLDVPDTQEALAEAIAKVRAVINRYNEDPAPAAPPKEAPPAKKAAPAATPQDVQNAIEAYAAAYGTEATLQDRVAINETVLGPVPAGLKNANGQVVTYWPVSAMPADKLGAVVTAWTAALDGNPYGREAV